MNDDLWDWLLSEVGQDACKYLQQIPAQERWARARHEPWSLNQTEAILTQLDLRKRAAAKLDAAELWWLTRRGLEQASGSVVARYKAARYFPRGEVHDLCSGIGGDLMELARRGSVVSVEQDPRLIQLQKLTSRALGVERNIRFESRAVNANDLPADTAWHIDPDRRLDEKKSVHVERFSPGLEELNSLVDRASQGIIKLAPATPLPEKWDCAREWVGAQGECKQQLALCGPLTWKSRGHRVTVITRSGKWTSFEGCPGEFPDFMDRVPGEGEILHEPHAAFFAAGLVPALACANELQQVSPDCGYLVGDGGANDSQFTARFRVERITRLDPRKLKRTLAELDAGVLEVKKRGVPADWLTSVRKLKPKGQRPMTLLVFPFEKRVQVALATRLLPQE
ncbi:MAG: hypothetical protein VYC80_03155 [Planctomycetota bacterium]|nr:hypothetical protein [Planctomycetota bacterium]